MADGNVNETGFSSAYLRAITKIIAVAFAQERAQNQVPPASSNQPIVEEREIPEPTSGNQASAGNTTPVENDLIKQLAELKDKMPEFEDFLGIGDEASKVIQEQKSEARILQSLLAAEDAEEAERKMLEMKEKAGPETEDAPDADEVVQAIKDSCDECIE
ncbi:hypothetical protein JCGZ_02789 [Jatropha curcas]|uniref:Uncharacterized protein n=1 Tax=Jatropha curcas TaxID=180498 RepID=A0A067JFT2_JATCU|nr:hypothetical protein JCGZ_02789 [Jatropha curcas]